MSVHACVRHRENHVTKGVLQYFPFVQTSNYAVRCCLSRLQCLPLYLVYLNLRIVVEMSIVYSRSIVEEREVFS